MKGWWLRAARRRSWCPVLLTNDLQWWWLVAWSACSFAPCTTFALHIHICFIVYLQPPFPLAPQFSVCCRVCSWYVGVNETGWLAGRHAGWLWHTRMRNTCRRVCHVHSHAGGGVAVVATTQTSTVTPNTNKYTHAGRGLLPSSCPGGMLRGAGVLAWVGVYSLCLACCCTSHHATAYCAGAIVSLGCGMGMQGVCAVGFPQLHACPAAAAAGSIGSRVVVSHVWRVLRCAARRIPWPDLTPAPHYPSPHHLSIWGDLCTVGVSAHAAGVVCWGSESAWFDRPPPCHNSLPSYPLIPCVGCSVGAAATTE